jgi:gliding motility-associated-like protein
LTLYQSNLIASSSSYTYKYYTTQAGAELGQSQNQITNYTACNLSNSNNKVYVRVISNLDCYKVVELQFSFIDSPVINMHDRYPLCEFKNVFVDAHAGYDAYLWSTTEITQAITLRNPDDYWVTVYENHITPTGLLVCELRKDFEVFLSNPATITKIIKADWSVDDNSMIIKVDGLGIYEYSLDGINYQDSNTFSHLKSGDYKVYVRDKNNCGVVDEEVFLLMYPYYFTPNDDTYNDTWKINLSEFEKGLTIKIFDRNGKFLKELGNDVGWDGMLNGEKLPATDYWFVVTRANGKEYRGHFTLKR